MFVELGHFALILALCIAMMVGVAGIWGAARQSNPMLMLAKTASTVLAGLVALSFAALTYAFFSDDFSVLYVSRHSHSLMPTLYKISGVWGGHEGSLLLWVLMLVVWMGLVNLFSRQLPLAMVGRVLGVLALVATGFMAFMLFTSNPFDRLLIAPEEGASLNPMLQDPGLAFHPPILYMGYVGLAVPFAFAIAALLHGRLDAAWARWSRPWTVAAWIFLTLGIALGSYWAYYELGWGGWWFWDPVENASFLPWLLSTALIHSLAVTEKRGTFRNWTVVLAITGFLLSLLGTFLVRSGVLTSVHAFASDPTRGVFILAFLVIAMVASFTLFALRAHTLTIHAPFALISRDSFLLANNVLLTTACATVLLGTLYPLIVDSLGLGKLSVGPPYFNAVFVPLMLPLMLLLGLGPMAKWKNDSLPALLRALTPQFIGALALGAALPFAFDAWTWQAAIGLGLAAWLALSIGKQAIKQMRTQNSFGGSLSFWGMQAAHFGLAVTVVGITLVSQYASENDVKMAQGEVVQAGDYAIKRVAIEQVQGVNYAAQRGTFELTKNGKLITTLHPEKRQYVASTMPMTEAGIDSGFTRDVYISLGDPLVNNDPTGPWSVRVYYKPYVNWIWWGTLWMALGGILAALDRRYRKRVTQTQTTPRQMAAA